MSDSIQPLRLSASQLKVFERDGYLLLPGLLSSDEVARYTSVVDELERRERAEKNLSATDSIEIRDSIARARTVAADFASRRAGRDARHSGLGYSAHDFAYFRARAQSRCAGGVQGN